MGKILIELSADLRSSTPQDGTIVATILSTIGSEFKVSQTIGWIGTSYLLTQTAFQRARFTF